MIRLIWTVSLLNRKTGPIATAYVGETLEDALHSCLGCSLLGGKCYAWASQVRRGAASVFRAHAAGNGRTLPEAFRDAPDKRAVRFGAIGDPGRADLATGLAGALWARSRGAAVLAYTHHWRDLIAQGKGPEARDLFMASCDDWTGARTALACGWVPTVVVPQDTPKIVKTSTGHTFLRCPAITQPGRVTCGSCGLCDPQRLRKTKWAGIMFPLHGPSAPRTPARRAAFNAKRLPVAEEPRDLT